MDKKEEFTKFLKKHGALRKFKKNLIVPFEDYPTNTLPVTEMLGAAFNWSLTKEDHTYWSELDSKWREYLKLQNAERNPRG